MKSHHITSTSCLLSFPHMADSSSCLSSLTSVFHDLLGEGAAKEVAADWQLQQVTRSHGVARWIGLVGGGRLSVLNPGLTHEGIWFHASKVTNFVYV